MRFRNSLRWYLSASGFLCYFLQKCMNYLAHAYLAGPTETAIVGGILGDFVKGRSYNRFPLEIAAGIRLHRRIDGFTDRHPATLAGRRLFAAKYRRFAGVILDIAFDHFLTKQWSQYASIPLTRFTSAVYTALIHHQALFPPNFRRVLPRLIHEDWLGSYGRMEGVAQTLNRLSHKLTRPNPLAESIGQVTAHYPKMEAIFSDLFPDLVAFVKNHPPAP